MKQELIRLKAGLLALTMSLSLTACSNDISGFIYRKGENNNYIAESDVYINDVFIKRCQVAEIYNELTGETELRIVKNTKEYFDATLDENIIEYNDILTPNSVLFSSNNDLNNFIKLNQLIPLEDYINALELTQYQYSYDDMIKILEEIKTVHEYSDNLELTK